MCTRSSFFLLGEGGKEGVEPQTKLSKRGDLTVSNRISIFREGCWEKGGWGGGVTFFRGLQFLHENELKSEVFNNKKVIKQKFFSLS